MTGPEAIRVGGEWQPTAGDITVTTTADEGCAVLSFGLDIDPNARPAGIEADAITELHAGALIFSGDLTQPDWAAGTFTAQGCYRQLEGAVALGPDGQTTTTPNDAVDQAIARGASNLRRITDLGSTPLKAGDETDNLNSVAGVLDEWCDTNGHRWPIWSDRIVRYAYDPTEPDWWILPGVVGLNWVSERSVGRMIGRWQDSVGNLSNVIVGTGRPEVAIDLTNRGPLADAATASAILEGYLAKTTTLQVAGSLMVTSTQITSPGGVHPHLSLIRGGQMARVLDLPDPRTGLPWTDFVIGRAVWNVSQQTISLTPVDAPAEDLNSFVAEQGDSVSWRAS